ncbi:MAG: SPOR domain-containing protein, partial [Alphaproteobacteria bacterium]
ARIRAASEVAELAYTDGEGDGDTLPAQISRIAQLRYPSTAHRTEHPVGQNHEMKTVQPIPASRDGWHIQVAAVPSESAAQSILRKVQARAGGLLVSADPFTQPVNANGVRLYRARFAGFFGKKEARSICRKLKKKSVTCLAVPG